MGSSFQPARSKIEAVTRIAALTNAPKEWLGPGGKEHKSVLINLADRLLPDARAQPVQQDQDGRLHRARLRRAVERQLRVDRRDDQPSPGST